MTRDPWTPAPDLTNRPDGSVSIEPDALAGLAWWDAITDGERVYWMDRAGNSGVATDAWAAFKRSRDPLAQLDDDERFGEIVEEVRASRIAAGLDPDTGGSLIVNRFDST